MDWPFIWCHNVGGTFVLSQITMHACDGIRQQKKTMFIVAVT